MKKKIPMNDWKRSNSKTETKPNEKNDNNKWKTKYERKDMIAQSTKLITPLACTDAMAAKMWE